MAPRLRHARATGAKRRLTKMTPAHPCRASAIDTAAASGDRMSWRRAAWIPGSTSRRLLYPASVVMISAGVDRRCLGEVEFLGRYRCPVRADRLVHGPGSRTSYEEGA